MYSIIIEDWLTSIQQLMSRQRSTDSRHTADPICPTHEVDGAHCALDLVRDGNLRRPLLNSSSHRRLRALVCGLIPHSCPAFLPTSLTRLLLPLLRRPVHSPSPHAHHSPRSFNHARPRSTRARLALRSLRSLWVRGAHLYAYTLLVITAAGRVRALGHERHQRHLRPGIDLY